MNRSLFVANWKMQFSFHQAASFIKTNIGRLSALAQLPDVEIVLCPTFTDLYAAALLVQDTKVMIGAQDVSRFESGAHTGQVSALSLAEIGCTYALVGHAESRRLLQESCADITQKCERLFAQGIIPIICVDQETLEEQLASITRLLIQVDPELPYAIAFEPAGAIGTGNVPDKDYLQTVFKQLEELCSQNPQPFSLLYGGSVRPENARELLAIKQLIGLLIGGASLDIANLEAIVTQYR